jgi:hypothetical protein
MKRFHLILVSLMAGVAGVTAQGTVQFANASGGLTAPFFNTDGTTRLGSDFSVQLDAGPDDNLLEPLAVTTFLDGSGAGYFNGGVVAVPTVTPGEEGRFQLSIWWNAGQSITSYAMAETSGVWRGYSSVFANVTADVGSPPLALTGMMDATWTWVPGIIQPELEISLEAGNVVITWQAPWCHRPPSRGHSRPWPGPPTHTK